MSDFLGRLAARAVGEAAAAQPRLPAAFEPRDVASEAPLEIVDEEVVAPGPPRPAHDEAAPDVARAAPPAPSPQVPVRRAGKGLTGAREAAPIAPPAEIAPTLPVSEARHDEREPDRREAVRAEPGTSRPAATPVAAVPVAPASPALVAAARTQARPAPEAVASDEPPPVRVHIGRLEVRANLQEPPGEHPRREPRQPEGLSLGDYLRGKREVAR